MLNSTFIIFPNRETIYFSYYSLLLEIVTMERISFALNYLEQGQVGIYLTLKTATSLLQAKLAVRASSVDHLLTVQDLGKNVNQLSMMNHSRA